MEAQNRDQIVDELRQLCVQYQNEVPSRRRTWPRSIKERVLQLLQLELSCEEVAGLTGIPAPTIYSWKPRTENPEPGFLPVQVVAEKILPERRPAAPRKRERKRTTPTIIVIAPNGTRFEGLDLKSALAVARETGSWS